MNVNGDKIKTYISGPENSLLKENEEICIPLDITIDKDNDQALLEVSGQKIKLKREEFSEWIKLTFRPGLGMKVKAICRFYICSLESPILRCMSRLLT